MCERRYLVGEQWYNVRPDALAAYRVGQHHLLFWLEWDRGTMNVRDLAIKFTSYAHFIASRQWAGEDARVPWLLCVAPDIAQEKRIQRVTQARLAHTAGLVICTTTEVLLNEHGPLAPIWRLRTAGCGQEGRAGSVQRNGLLQLLPQSKGMWGGVGRFPAWISARATEESQVSKWYALRRYGCTVTRASARAGCWAIRLMAIWQNHRRHGWSNVPAWHRTAISRSLIHRQ